MKAELEVSKGFATRGAWLAVLAVLAVIALAPRAARAQPRPPAASSTGIFCACELSVIKPNGFNCQAYCCARYPGFQGCAVARPAPAAAPRYNPVVPASSMAAVGQGLDQLASSGARWDKRKAEVVVQVPNPVRARALAQLELLKQKLNVERGLDQFFDGRGMSSFGAADGGGVALNENAATPGLLRGAEPAPPQPHLDCEKLLPTLPGRRERLRAHRADIDRLLKDAQEGREEATKTAEKEATDALLETIGLAFDDPRNKERLDRLFSSGKWLRKHAEDVGKLGDVAQAGSAGMGLVTPVYEGLLDLDRKNEGLKKETQDATAALYDALHHRSDAKTVHDRLMAAERRWSALWRSYVVLLDSGLVETAAAAAFKPGAAAEGVAKRAAGIESWAGKRFTGAAAKRAAEEVAENAAEAAEWQFKVGLYAGKLVIHGAVAGWSLHDRARDLEVARRNFHHLQRSYFKEEDRIDEIARSCPNSQPGLH